MENFHHLHFAFTDDKIQIIRQAGGDIDEKNINEEVAEIFKYDKDMANGRLCQLFAEHGGLMSDGVNLIRKDGSLYRTISQDKIHIELRKLLTPETRLDIGPSQLDTIIKLLLQNPEINVDVETHDTGKIIFRNGIYHVANATLYPHDRKYNWACVDANYKDNTKIEDATTFLSFARSSLDYETQPEKTELLLEILGYCLSDYTTAKKAFFFIGEPSSGKSKILEFLQRLLGDEEVSQISLPLIGSRFSMGQLRGKRLNVCTELPSNKFPSIESFKALTACDRVYGELKGKDGFSYFPRIKLINAGNNVPFPSNADGTFSVVDRMVFLIFSHTIPRSQWNLNLVDDLLVEKDIICSLAMQRLKKLAELHFEFTSPHDSKILARGYSDALNAFNLFITEECVLKDNVQISSQRLWEEYQNFCAENAFPKGITRQIFVQKVEALKGVNKQRIRENGRQISVFKGIDLRGANDDSIKILCDIPGVKESVINKSATKISKKPSLFCNLKTSCTPAQGEIRPQNKYGKED